MGDKMTDETRSELFRKSIASEEDRTAFAESWGEMINEVLPVEATVRGIFTVENIPAGAVPIYTNDVQPFSAWYLPKFGQTPQNIVEIDEVTVPTFEITADVEYKLRDAKHARISIADRAMQRMIDSIVDLEEEAGWDVLRAASSGVSGGHTPVSGAASSGLTKSMIDTAFKMFESHRGYQITDIFVSPSGAADIRGWTQTTIDPVTQREIFVNAGLGSIYGVPIKVCHFLSASECYFMDLTPGKLGYMPIRDALQTFDDPVAIKKFRVGVFAREEIGFVVMDSLAIMKGVPLY
jgi:hypothetical protein